MPSYEASKYYGRDWDHWKPDAAFTRDRVQCILLQEIRDELKMLNALLRCPNFQRIPHELWDIGMEARRQARLRRERAKRVKGRQGAQS